MTNTNDIDALLRLWSESARSDHRRYHRALTALIAERDEYKARCKAQHEVMTDMVGKEREVDRDRDLRERLVCAIWPEILRIFERTDTTHNNGANWELVRINARDRALTEADAMIAEMRKEGGGA